LGFLKVKTACKEKAVCLGIAELCCNLLFVPNNLWGRVSVCISPLIHHQSGRRGRGLAALLQLVGSSPCGAGAGRGVMVGLCGCWGCTGGFGVSISAT